MEEKVIGILGGMGPEATVEIFHRIVKATPAKRDQDHLRIIIDNNPKIPDRTAAILGRGRNPLPVLVETAKNLERAGADFIVMPCATAHYYYAELSKNVNIPVLNMIELTAQAIKERFPYAKKVGLLATVGTIKARIYDQVLEKAGIEIIVPPASLEEKVMKVIYDVVKAGKALRDKRAIYEVADYLIEKGAEVIIYGCTEIPLILKDSDLAVPVADSLQILAEAAVKTALKETR